MPQERVEALESLGFLWKVREIHSWDTMYQQLQAYHQQHGHVNVTCKKQHDHDNKDNNDDDSRLVRWVQQQRRHYRRDKLSHDKVIQLNQLGFVWRLADTTAKGGGIRRENIQEWNRMYLKLEQYKTQHGHCLVPRDYEHDLELGRWVRQQRSRRALTSQQTLQLDSLGFVWKVPHKKKAQVSFEDMLQRLHAFKNRYGDCMVPAIYPDDLQLGMYACTSMCVGQVVLLMIPNYPHV